MMVTAEMDLDQFGLEENVEQFSDDDAWRAIELEVFSYWEAHGYPIDGLLEAHSVVNKKPDDEDSGHIVLKVETLEKPVHEADALADKTGKWTCDCRAFQYHHGVDLAEKNLLEWESCKHIQEVDSTVKAMNDPDKSQLGP